MSNFPSHLVSTNGTATEEQGNEVKIKFGNKRKEKNDFRMPNSCWTTANSLPHCRFHVLIDPRCLSHSASLRLFLLAVLGEWFISTAGNAGLSRPMISRWSGGPSVNPCWRLGSITNTMSCLYPENLFETKGLHVEDHILTWSLQSSSTLSSAARTA